MSEHSTEVAVIEQHQLAPLENPQGFVAGYVAMADELARVIRDKQLASAISGRQYVRVEGWTLLGSMLGVFPICVWTRPVERDGAPVGWEARVEARTRDGAVVGAAEAECLRDESKWKSRDDYALRSMAQTRATSKALRQPLGFVMTIAGFEATPAEEVPHSDESATISEPQRRRLFAKAKNANVSDARLAELVMEIAGVESTAAIPRDRYEALIEAVEMDSVPFGDVE